MHDSARMGEGHASATFIQISRFSSKLFLDDVVPGRALDALHRVEQHARVVLAQVVDRHDVRMFQIAGHDGFGEEGPAGIGLLGLFGLDLLQGHGAVDRGLPGVVDDAHAAFAQFGVSNS